MSKENIRHKPQLMTHIIPSYPDFESSLAAAHTLINCGITMLELQFPFSDPSADGPIIQEACNKAIEQGFTVRKGFEFIKNLPVDTVDVFVMTYANIIYTMGIQPFVQNCKDLGVRGLIVPDLPPDSDEGLSACCKEAGIANVAVTLTTALPHRLQYIRAMAPSYIYVSMRSGLTGSYTQLHQRDLDILNSLRSDESKVIAGFGIRSPEQIQRLSPYTDIVVVGSAVVEHIRDYGAESSELKTFLTSLILK